MWQRAPWNVVLIAAIAPLVAGTDCRGDQVVPGCDPCPPPVTLVLTAATPIHDVAITAEFSGASHLSFACEEGDAVVRCTVFPIDNLGSVFSGRYTISIAAPGFATQTVTVDVPPQENTDNARCFCYLVPREVEVTLAP